MPGAAKHRLRHYRGVVSPRRLDKQIDSPTGDQMADDKDVLDRLERYAKAIARRLLQRYDLAHDHGRHEDISQLLFLDGYLDWQKTGDEGLAKHRMSSRAINAEENLRRELAQPQPLSSLNLPSSSGSGDDTDSTERYHADSTEMPFRHMRWDHISRASPLEDIVVREYLNGLPERQRRILQCRAALMTVSEIANELGISERTVDRELKALRKDHHDDDDK